MGRKFTDDRLKTYHEQKTNRWLRRGMVTGSFLCAHPQTTNSVGKKYLPCMTQPIPCNSWRVPSLASRTPKRTWSRVPGTKRSTQNSFQNGLPQTIGKNALTTAKQPQMPAPVRGCDGIPLETQRCPKTIDNIGYHTHSVGRRARRALYGRPENLRFHWCRTPMREKPNDKWSNRWPWHFVGG